LVYQKKVVSTEPKIHKNGVLIIADAGLFFQLNKTEKLIEQELPKCHLNLT
jgi:hypothetical protein